MKTWTNKVQPFLGRKIFGGKFLTHTLHLNILPSLSLSLASPRDGTPRKNARSKGRKREGGGFFVHANWPIVFFKGQTTHPFLSSPPFIRPFPPPPFFSPLAARLLDPPHFGEKGGRNERRRNGGYQMYGNKARRGS